MLRNYLVVAWRNLVRQKVYSLINTSGLAIGVACCLLIYLYLRHEWTYDTFHREGDRIYLVHLAYKFPGVKKFWTVTPPILAPTLSENFPEVERAVRFRPFGGGWNFDALVSHGDRVLTRRGMYADPEVFEVFSFPQLAGDVRTALHDPHSVVITPETAVLYFGEEDPLGKSLTLRGGGKTDDLIVRGVVEVPENSSIQFDFLLSLNLLGELTPEWQQGQVFTFVQLADKVNAATLEQEFLAFFTDRFDTPTAEDFGSPAEPLRLVSLRDIHLDTDIDYKLDTTSDPLYSYILAGIALAVLLIACINFTNLSTALSSTRLKEIGMRKVLGATRTQLGRQFWGEALLASFIALFLGVALAEFFLPEFNSLTGKHLDMDYPATWPVLLALALLIGLVTGSFPGLTLSSFQPIEVLKGRLRIGGPTRFSRSLITLQFAFSILLITTTLIMSKQMAHLRAKNLGFEAEQVVVIDAGDYGLRPEAKELRHLMEVYRQAAAQYPDVLNVSFANMSFGSTWIEGRGVEYGGHRESVAYFDTDYDYLETLGIELVEGRNFSREFLGDVEHALLVNEALVELMGWDSAVGKTPQALRPTSPDFGKTIVGVVKDFHFRPLHLPIESAMFHLSPDSQRLRYIFARISSDDMPATLALLKDQWDQVIPDYPFVFSFLDQDVERTFREDERWMAITRYSALFAVFVACLGVFGLTSLAVARRTKEIGIRKVLGASVPSIVTLLSKEFTYLVLAANLIAWPLAWYAMNKWLQSFAYRIELGPGVFVLGGVLALVIAWLTVSYQAIRAARANPVEALRYE